MTVVLGGWGLWAFSTANEAFQITANQSLPAVEYLTKADRDMQQAVVAERSLMFMSMASQAAKDQITVRDQNIAEVEGDWKKYTALAATEAERKLWPSFEAALSEWKTSSGDVLKILAEDTPQARRDAIDLSIGEATGKFEKVRKSLEELTSLRITQAGDLAAAQNLRERWIRYFLVTFVIVAVVLALWLSLMLVHTIASPLSRTVELLEDIAEGEGDLTRYLEVRSRDEMGQLGEAFNKMIKGVRGLIMQVRDTSLHVSASGNQIRVAAEQQASGATQQASAVTEASTTVVELASTASRIAENAQNLSAVADAMLRGMQEINEKVGHSAQKILVLGEKTQAIGNITKLIDDLADQTNLLALNAAIEAARAGEAGRGFAVVASEVRKLAERSTESTKDIRQLIQEIQVETHAAIMGVEDSTKWADKGLNMVGETVQVIKEISIGTQQQKTAADQVVKVMENISEVTRQFVASTKQLATSAGQLDRVSVDLKVAIGGFKLDGDGSAPAKPAVTAHEHASV